MSNSDSDADCEDFLPGVPRDLAQRARSALHRLNFQDLRPAQVEPVTSLLLGKSCICVLPTGGGKSLIYRLPGLVRGITLVISPLLSLIADQMGGLLASGIRARAWTSSTPQSEKTEILEALRDSNPGGLEFLFMAPEGLQAGGYIRSALEACAKAGRLGLVAIDEAHCISQWGHDFRPSYTQIGHYGAGILAHAPVVALTATATEAVVGDIRSTLRLEGAALYCSSFNRPNITYITRFPEQYDSSSRLDDIYHQLSNIGTTGAGIVYCRTRRCVEELAAALSDAGLAAAPYHAGLKDRDSVLRDWLGGSVKVVVATIAFGMGIDHPRVRVVIHYNIANSVEAYLQESGRAGRDGAPALALYYFDRSDVQWAQTKAASTQRELASFNCLLSALTGDECRRRGLLSFFKDEANSRVDDGIRCCDVCSGEAPKHTGGQGAGGRRGAGAGAGAGSAGISSRDRADAVESLRRALRSNVLAAPHAWEGGHVRPNAIALMTGQIMRAAERWGSGHLKEDLNAVIAALDSCSSQQIGFSVPALLAMRVSPTLSSEGMQQLAACIR